MGTARIRLAGQTAAAAAAAADDDDDKTIILPIAQDKRKWK